MKKIITILLILFCSEILAQKTEYSQIPKTINNQIQKEYTRNNVFYLYFEDDAKTYLIWKYENSKVYWKLMKKNSIQKSGEFDSEIKSSELSIDQTNQILQEEITIFEEKNSCHSVLDGLYFGYVYSIDQKEIIGIETISGPLCLENNQSKIAKDLDKIIKLNFTIEIIE